LIVYIIDIFSHIRV